MYLGRFILGEEVPVVTLADDGKGRRLQPGVPVSFSVYDASGAVVASGRAPAIDRGRQEGFFCVKVALDGRFAAGRYMVRASWADGIIDHTEPASFDVVAGGHADGQVVSHRFLSRPGGDSLLRKTDGGRRKIGRRPTP